MGWLRDLVETFVVRKPQPRDDALPRFTCPACGATSYNLKDVKWGYCGRCHTFTDHGRFVAEYSQMPAWIKESLKLGEELQMKKSHQKNLETVLDDIDRYTLPGMMTAEEAVAFLEQLQTEIDSRKDGLKDDMKNADHG